MDGFASEFVTCSSIITNTVVPAEEKYKHKYSVSFDTTFPDEIWIQFVLWNVLR